MAELERLEKESKEKNKKAEKKNSELTQMNRKLEGRNKMLLDEINQLVSVLCICCRQCLELKLDISYSEEPEQDLVLLRVIEKNRALCGPFGFREALSLSMLCAPSNR